MKKWKFLDENWLAVLTGAVIFFVCIATFVNHYKDFASDLVSGIRTGRTTFSETGLNCIKPVIAGLEEDFSKNLYGNKYAVEIPGLFNRLMNKKVTEDPEARYTVYKMSNHQLTHNYTGYDMTDYAENYLKFAAEMKQIGIPLLYVQAPFKINKYNNELPYGIKDETNPLSDSFLEMISPECDTADLREVIHQEGFDYSSLFYNTDHHWTAETGLWASSVLADELCGRYGLELDTSHLSRENYTFTTYKNYMLGSQGKRTGMIYSGLDDFILIEPVYETKYHLQIPKIKLDKEGSCSETLLFEQYMGSNFYEDDPGRVYTGDNYALMVIQNLLSSNESKILLVKDSYSKSVIPFFASTCKELHVIDLRVYKHSVSGYAKENGIDCVVVMYNPSAVVRPEFFEFQKE